MVSYKKRWGVAVSAFNYRAAELGLISKGKATSNYVELSRRGWLKSEPSGLAREQSAILQDVVNDLLSRGVTKKKIASEIHVTPSEVEALLFGLANMVSIDGAGSTTPRAKVSLTLINLNVPLSCNTEIRNR